MLQLSWKEEQVPFIARKTVAHPGRKARQQQQVVQGRIIIKNCMPAHITLTAYT